MFLFLISLYCYYLGPFCAIFSVSFFGGGEGGVRFLIDAPTIATLQCLVMMPSLSQSDDRHSIFQWSSSPFSGVCEVSSKPEVNRFFYFFPID